MKKKLSMMKQLLIFFVDAKLLRIWADSKKKRKFFFNLCGQLFHLWTNRENRPKSCPKGYENTSNFMSSSKKRTEDFGVNREGSRRGERWR